jgi:DNA-binding transcriptional regulator LsrR (DeoR family)
VSTSNVSLDRSRLAWLREQARTMRARGWGKQDIARNLGISLRTVQRYTAGVR